MTGIREPSDAVLRAKHVNDQSRWWESAACAGAPFELFDSIGHSGMTKAERGRVDQARAICAGCPVVAECRTDADLLPDPSVRGGYTAAERRKQNRNRK